MLYCEKCNYISCINKTEEVGKCSKYLCEYANQVLTSDDILDLNVHPCYYVK